MAASGNAPDPSVHVGVRSRSAAVGIAFFGLLLGLCVAIPFLPGDPPPRSWVLLVAGAVLFGGMLVYSLGAWFASGCSYSLDAEGITRRRGRSATRVAWSAVRDLAVQPNLLGGGEMLISLRAERGRLLLAIPCDSLRDRGEALYAQVQRYLEPLFRAKAQAYASGQEHWRFGAVRDVVRIQGRQVLVEWPARRRTAIPLESLRRVEVVPKSRAGFFEPGHLRLDHPGGTLRIPLQVPGIYFLPYALRVVCGLATLPGATLDPDAAAERDRLAARLRWKMSCRLFAGLTLVGVLVVGSRIVLDLGRQQQTRTLGEPATATVTALPQKDFVALRYADGRGKAHLAKTRVVPGFAEALQVGDTIPIRVHPAIAAEYWFEGRWQLTGRGWLLVGSLLGVLGLAGVAFLLNGFLGVGALRRRLAQVEAAAVPPVSSPVLLPSALPAVPVPPPVPTSPLSAPAAAAVGVPAAATAGRALAAEGGVCSQCAQSLAGSYFLSAGQAWCPACTERGRLLTPATGCRPLALAVLFGALAAVAAGGLWAVIVILTGYQLGLVAIVVGILVGLAVRRGSGSTGGRRYQVLAMAMTLAALAYASVPIAIDALRNDPETMARLKGMWNQAKAGPAIPAPAPVPDDVAVMLDEEADAAPEETDADGTAPAAPDSGADGAPEPVVDPGVALTPPPATAADDRVPVEVDDGLEGTEPEPLSPAKAIGMMALALLGLVLAVTVGPFLLYAMLLIGDPFSLLFLAIALWEAWRFNRPQERTFDGPFQVRPDPIDFTEAKP